MKHGASQQSKLRVWFVGLLAVGAVGISFPESVVLSALGGLCTVAAVVIGFKIIPLRGETE